MRKRSKKVTPRIVATAILIGAALSFSSCADQTPEPMDVRLYESLRTCIQGKVFTPTYCQDAYQVAQEIHLDAAPRFEQKSECLSSYKECEQQDDYDDDHLDDNEESTVIHTYIPRSSGYYVGYSSSSHVTFGQPAYRTYNTSTSTFGSYTSLATEHGAFSTRTPGAKIVTTNRAFYSRPMAPTTTIVRGGFGRAITVGG